jgi:hypothetical protein
VLLGAIIFPGTAVAEVYEYDFSGDLCIWDLSETRDTDFLGINMDYTVTQDSKGKLSGYGSASASEMGIDFYLTYTITGSVTQRNGIAYIKFTMKIKGTAYDGWDTYKFKASATVNADLDPDVQLITGTIKISVAMGRYKETWRDDYEEDLPAGMNGSFKMRLDYDANGKKLLGDAELELSNGDIYAYAVKGTAVAKKSEDRLTLSAPKMPKLKVYVDETTGDLNMLSGKVLGQKLKAVY